MWRLVLVLLGLCVCAAGSEGRRLGSVVLSLLDLGSGGSRGFLLS